MKRKLIIDAHLDLGMNAVEWNRDLRLPVSDIRERERGMVDQLDRGKGTVSLPALREGNVGLVVATQLARYVPQGRPNDNDPYFNSPEIAWSMTQAQMAYYKVMEDLGEMKQIVDKEELLAHVEFWSSDESTDNCKKPVGFISSLEGADSLVTIGYLEKAYGYGLRVLGPSHYGVGRYAAGTGGTDGFTKIGFELLEEMDRLHMILDITHLTDMGFGQALSLYKGPIWASHHNCRSLVGGQRQLSDEQILQLIERGSVIGGALDNWMLVAPWTQGKDDPFLRGIGLEKVIDHYDHICQLAGNSLHCAIGSDLDGMFGKEQCPYDLDTIADLQSLSGLLDARGYTEEDIDNIFYRNWFRFLMEHLN